tara:strand:- start:246 stop:449 length:204 start_codon:yes stop_codon:yes gene_type:complete
MRQTDGSMRTVSLGTTISGTSEFIKLTDIDDEELPICNRIIGNNAAQFLIGTIIILCGITIAIMYIM